jgi:hypothetical protein
MPMLRLRSASTINVEACGRDCVPTYVGRSMAKSPG